MWLNYGDANTKYFHLKTIQCRSHSQVVTLKDDTGLWLTGEPLTQHIYTTFKKLFQATSPHQCPSSRTDRQFCPNSPFFNLPQDLARIPHPEEIFRTLQELPPPPLKGPRTGWIPCALLPNKLVKFGPKHHSGHSSHPYTAHSPSKLGWHELGPYSKVAHPELITQFRPISLCNTLYKLLSRIIVHRLKPYMAKVINPYQVGFVLSHRASDNIIIIREVIRTLISHRGRTRYVALKLDLEKAYDRLEWHFI